MGSEVEVVLDKLCVGVEVFRGVWFVCTMGLSNQHLHSLILFFVSYIKGNIRITKARLGTRLYSVLKRQVYSINISTFPMTPFFAATHDDSVHPSQVVAGMQQIRPEQQKLTTPFYRMKKDSLRFQKLRFLFTWSRPRRSSLSPTTSERMSSNRTHGQFSNNIR